MEAITENNYNKWNKAAINGLLLAAIAIICSCLGQIKLPSFCSIILWLAQTVASIWLLAIFMKNHVAATGHSPFRFGLATAVFSAFVIAVFSTAAYLWIFPGMHAQITETFEMIMSQPTFPSEASDTILKIEANFGRYLFFVNFIKDSLIGLIATAIISGSISKPQDIFAETETDNSDNELE